MTSPWAVNAIRKLVVGSKPHIIVIGNDIPPEIQTITVRVKGLNQTYNLDAAILYYTNFPNEYQFIGLTDDQNLFSRNNVIRGAVHHDPVFGTLVWPAEHMYWDDTFGKDLTWNLGYRFTNTPPVGAQLTINLGNDLVSEAPVDTFVQVNGSLHPHRRVFYGGYLAAGAAPTEAAGYAVMPGGGSFTFYKAYQSTQVVTHMKLNWFSAGGQSGLNMGMRSTSVPGGVIVDEMVDTIPVTNAHNGNYACQVGINRIMSGAPAGQYTMEPIWKEFGVNAGTPTVGAAPAALLGIWMEEAD